MNVNEVIANIANNNSKYFDIPIDPNDDVNKSQSTNDTFPTAGKMALIHYFIILKKSLDLLMESLLCKSKEFENNVKIGRTQLEEAVPTTLGKSFKAYY